MPHSSVLHRVTPGQYSHQISCLREKLIASQRPTELERNIYGHFPYFLKMEKPNRISQTTIFDMAITKECKGE